MKEHASSIKKPIPRCSGIVVPIGAIRTDFCPVVGEYTGLIPFARFCKRSGLSIIQLLPVNDTGTQSSPYSELSAFALHPVYITLSAIPEFSLLMSEKLSFAESYNTFIKNHSAADRWDYDSVVNEKDTLLRSLYDAVIRHAGSVKKLLQQKEFSSWIRGNPWVVSYSVYKNLKYTYLQSSWKSWPEKDRNLSKTEINRRWNDELLKEKQLYYTWVQFAAWKQFSAAADEIRKLGLILKGDLPILMNEDSCDSWSEPDLFNQALRAGSPPDADNPEGQNWDFPIYNWTVHQKENFSWWKDRLSIAEQFYDAFRIDHVLGFFRIWCVTQGDHTALLGHPEPYWAITADELEHEGFSKERIHWLSEPHIPTNAIDKNVLSLFCDRIGSQELWNFKKTIHGERDLDSVSLSKLVSTLEDERQLRNSILAWWRNRALIPLSDDCYVPQWQYSETTSWKSLNTDEQRKLTDIFSAASQKQEQIWENQGRMLLGMITNATKMIPCAEDLGVNVSGVQKVLAELSILSLNVVRWCRQWQNEHQPFVPFSEYRPLSVTTTSVHDSTTLREWWNTEKENTQLFKKSFQTTSIDLNADSNFSPEAADFFLSSAAQTESVWYINPIQDWLDLEKQYWISKESNERINIPGTVTAFNWTYRLPVTIEELTANNDLIQRIEKIVKMHDRKTKEK